MGRVRAVRETRRAAIVPGALRDAGGASAGDSEKVSRARRAPARVRQRARGRGERSEGGQGRARQGVVEERRTAFTTIGI